MDMDDLANSSIREFSVGDTIVIGLPGGGFCLAMIGRMNVERMFLTTFGPGFKAQPRHADLQAWSPKEWSSWVASTLGLCDGSWTKIVEPPAMANILQFVDVFSMPRFKFESRTGARMLAEYDPSSLYVRDITENFEGCEYERAPTLVSPDATTFEYALSLTMDSPCELPDPARLKMLNEQRQVVSMIREKISDRTADVVFDHCLIFRSNRGAGEARRRLIDDGFDVSEPVKDGWLGPTTIDVRVRSQALYPLVLQQAAKLEAFAIEFGGEYDGVGAAIP